MKEIRLQRIWAQQAFYPYKLETTAEQTLSILNRGQWNHQDGPDFLDAEILINDVQLLGAVEIHVDASDWYAHGHHTDPRYNQTVLHVVLHNNADCFLENGQSLACLELKGRVTDHQLSQSDLPPQMPCEPLLSLIKSETRQSQLNMALTKRIHEKTEKILHKHQTHLGDWWYTALESIFIAWMGKANEQASETIVHNLHKSFLMRNKNPLTLTAYLFGQAGWLEGEDSDDFQADLKERYVYLQHKHSFIPSTTPWNTRQIRPSSFPQIRMAQFATWLNKTESAFHEIFFHPETNLTFWEEHFNAHASEYWENHYQLGKHTSKQHNTNNGQQHAQQVITNGLIPLLFAYGLESHRPQRYELGIQLLEKLPPENNRIVRSVSVLGCPNKTAKDSQSLIAQFRHYCDQKACGQCLIGQELLNFSFIGQSP